jgi:hypothetical protein
MGLYDCILGVVSDKPVQFHYCTQARLPEKAGPPVLSGKILYGPAKFLISPVLVTGKKMT